jgi:2,4-dienoyl-CoA reductase-like NADH-dependent reductase (Old Yellow Enzyme family)
MQADAAKRTFQIDTLDSFGRVCEQLGCSLHVREDVSILAEPVVCGGLRIPNSLAVHPMEGADGDAEGRPGPLTLRRYERFAAGGAGLIWAEAIAVVPEGRANPRQLWLHEGSKAAFAELIEMMRRVAAESMGAEHRPVIVAQLTHSGRYSKPDGVLSPIVPQRDPFRDPMQSEPTPTMGRKGGLDAYVPLATDAYLDDLQQAYVESARLAFEVGFDAVDIKACHGYLIHELLAGRRREGKYGGSFENRTRFLLETVDRIQSACGVKEAVTTRLNFYDAIPYPFGWGVDKRDYRRADLTEPNRLVELLLERGVRLINFTIANPYYNPHLGRPYNRPIKGGYPEPEHPLTGVERLIVLAGQVQRRFADVAVVGTGYSWLGHLMGHVAAAARAEGMIRIVGAGRMAFAYPDFARDLLTKGVMDKKKVCVACSGCTELMRSGQPTGCVVRDKEVYHLSKHKN